MDSVDWKKITDKWVELIRDLVVGDVLPYLIQDGFIHIHEKERIDHLPNHKEKAATFLEILKSRHGSYKCFYNALERTHRHLMVMLPAPEEKVTEFEMKKKIKKNTDRLQKQYVNHIKRKESIKEPAPTHSSTVSNPDSQANHISLDNLKSLSVEQLCDKLQSWAEQEGISKAFLDVLTDEGIDGSVLCAMTDEEMKKLFPCMLFGHRKKLQLLVQGATWKRTNKPTTENKLQEEILEEFDKSMKPTSSYKHQAIIRGKETRVTNMTNPIHRFLSSEVLGNDNPVLRIAEETVKFAAACLNSRTNGTVHFGISDDQKVGLSVEGLSVDQTKCQKEIDQVMSNRFFVDQLEIVSRCIRPARFVEVIQAQAGPLLYVVEVDVVPNISLVQEHAFFLQATKPGKQGHKNVKLYEFREDRIHDLSGDEVRQYMDRKQNLSEARKLEDEKYIKDLKAKHLPNLAKKFTQLFCGGGNTFDGDLYPVLICGKPNEKSRCQISTENFDFLKRIDWQIVLDFDDCAKEPNLYNLYEIQQAKTTSTIPVEDFDPKRPENVEDKGQLERTLDELSSSCLPPWVFLNGYTPISSEIISPAEWKKKRGIGFKKLLTHYHEVIPEHRAAIVVLIMSKEQGILVDILTDEVFPKFENQWMVITEDEASADTLKRELIRRNEERDSVNDRFVVGIPWQHLSELVKGLVEPSTERECQLSTSTGAPCVLKEKVKGSLTDIEVLSLNQCENTGIEVHPDRMSKLEEDEETRFYKGDEVSWWNFRFQDHVCRRKQYDELLSEVRSCLKGDISDGSKVGRVYLYHQPGAGSTTVSKQVLWDLRKEYRCCVIKHISDQTCTQINKLRAYEERENAQPVLALVDNLDEEKVDQLYAELEESGRQSGKSLQNSEVHCVLLLCYRRPNVPRQYRRKRVWLTHEFSEDELLWFNRKYTVLERNHQEKQGVDPRTLIAFNILKENFNPKYIQRAAQGFVDGITDNAERTLLKYVSLISSYDIDFRPIPVASFDPIMSACEHQRKPVVNKRWETRLSSSLKVILSQKHTQGLRGAVQGVRIVTPLLSREILKLLRGTPKPQTVADVMFEFLHSEILKSRNDSYRQLVKIIKNLVKKRAWLHPGKHEKFSPLILEIREEESVDTAADVMITVYEKTDDPMVAQQIARLYIEAENWRKAEDYAKVCTTMRPSNSCAFDTYGQIYRKKLQVLNKQTAASCSLGSHEPTSEELEAIDEAFTGIDIFRHEQKVSKNEATMPVSNTAGYVGEVQVTILLLDLLKLLAPFKDKNIFHRFLVDPNFCPDSAERCLGSYRCERIKQLCNDSSAALASLDDEFLQLKESAVDDFRKNLRNISRASLIVLKECHDKYFGEGEDKVPNNLSEEEENEYRRRRVRSLGGMSLAKILDFRDQENGKDTLLRMNRLLLENVSSRHPESWDYKTIIGVSLALATFKPSHSLPSLEDIILWSSQGYTEAERNEDERIALECYFYFVMFNWPTGDGIDDRRCPLGNLRSAIDNLKKVFHRNYPRQSEKLPLRQKVTTVYHLGKGRGINQYTHFQELHGGQGKRTIKGELIWSSPETAMRLQILNGVLRNHGTEVQIQMESTQGSMSSIAVPSGMPIYDKSLWNKKVYFFLGFSWAGPRAFGITGDDPSTVPHLQAKRPSPKAPEYQVEFYPQFENINTVRQLLFQIEDMKRQKLNRRTWFPPEKWKLVHREKELKAKLDAWMAEAFDETPQVYWIFD